MIFSCTICRKAHAICFLLLFILIFTSCEKTTENEEQKEYAKLLQQSNSNSVTTHRWFYFTQDGFKETDIPRNAPEVELVPWTQAIRITASSFVNGQSYFAVNKLGLMQAPPTFGFQTNGIASDTKLIVNESIFLPATVGDMYFIDEKILFNFYTNTIFEDDNNNTAQTNVTEPFLVEFNPISFKFTPILNMQILSESVSFQDGTENIPNFFDTEVREVFFTDNTWNILLKVNDADRTNFYALSFDSDAPLSKNNSPSLKTSMKSVTQYRELVRPKPYSALPQTMKNLLEPIPERISYYLSYSEENSPSPSQYEHLSNNTRPIEGYALGLGHCSIAVFEDGTICFAGGLPSKAVLNNGETRAFKLPDLGPGYVYGSIALSGSTLFVSWEESSFYETGASGFLAVDMEQVLYENTISGD